MFGTVDIPFSYGRELIIKYSACHLNAHSAFLFCGAGMSSHCLASVTKQTLYTKFTTFLQFLHEPLAQSLHIMFLKIPCSLYQNNQQGVQFINSLLLACLLTILNTFQTHFFFYFIHFQQLLCYNISLIIIAERLQMESSLFD